ncbi:MULTISPECIES: malonate decarboxylase holo-ACP synthase [Pseudomonas]|jgi:phosphoribosyl-dephospho-CoA transferase|uniref:Phosphoribosyl-dephospho-CoA transferase n=1 Tax=Pseudomonas cerasi TaxID=1583341 RepID=A0A193SW35_9PSED|nr:MULTISPECIES: malonate decarboxylase holo-ACP synthase [Pseudomonas]ALD98691.1 phosphoribosyl-dephospho-CoA transferase [Pseudomonas syringae UMAF0158]ELQ13507.1 phosphoribosyl-dephospho-CoA transferase [Pseudomonas syringae BRIP39023]KPB28577.1 Phosphoribosyl-dephospho-CoA transferase [Pseudomonas syringae pv. syringae]MBI6560345.1 malonate decarboxylase holo-ACP synthase [Pseudomonas syringae]MBI6573231.1 malonate decarboxylase holo-ACP synthase [Pseudomonas syringae]
MVISNTGAVLPHDLLWGMPLSALPDDAPKWAVEAVLAGQPVVVRRQAMPAGQVAVGLRGRGREQRYAASMPLADVCRRVMPEQLIEAPTESLQQWPALQALRQIRPVMEALELDWGVGGSAGFELASGIAALHQDSDLDLILRTPGRLSRRCAAELVEALETSVCRVDVQLQLEHGAVALREWARPTGRVLLKTASGARLVADPWHLGQVCA